MIDRFAGPNWVLSNFCPARIVVPHVALPALLARAAASAGPPAAGDGGVECASAEHAFQCLKTDDLRARAWVAEAAGPGEAKRRGRRVPLRQHWNVAWRHDAMAWVLARKFADPGRAAALAGTGDAVLVEGNTWHDQVFGDCVCGRPACAEPGCNLLGWGLMRQRAGLVVRAAVGSGAGAGR